MAKLLLAGYFGAGNLGDDAILQGFVHAITPHGHQFRVVANNPDTVARQYGYNGVGKLDSAKLKQAIAECDALVFPGGSVFQDVTSVRSVAYYSRLVAEAKRAGKKVALLGQGVGPLNRWLGKRFAAAAFNAADVIALRDPGSVSALKALGVKTNPRVTADSAFLLPPPPPASEESSAAFGVAGMKTVGVNARPWGRDKNKHVVAVFANFVRLLSANGYVPVMIPLDGAEDKTIIDAIAKVHGGKVPDLRGVANPLQLQQRLARMEAVVAMRLHAGILATTVEVPTFLVSYDPKVTAFANLLGLPAPPHIQGATADRLFAAFQEFIKQRDRTAQLLAKKRAELADAAQGNIQALQDALGR